MSNTLIFKNAKTAIMAFAASMMLALGLAFAGPSPASAQASNTCYADDGITVIVCPSSDDDVTVDDSVNLGDCAILNDGDAGDGGDGGNGNGGTGGSGGSGGDLSLSTDCSTYNNVTNVTRVNKNVAAAQAQAPAPAQQVSFVPQGGVSAGGGGAVGNSSASIVGLVGSVLTMGAGLALRRQFEL